MIEKQKKKKPYKLLLHMLYYHDVYKLKYIGRRRGRYSVMMNVYLYNKYITTGNPFWNVNNIKLYTGTGGLTNSNLLQTGVRLPNVNVYAVSEYLSIYLYVRVYALGEKYLYIGNGF